MENPSKITEDGVEFSLGRFDGKKMNYDFEKILVYLNVKGKLLFGKHFSVYEKDRETVFKLCNYFVKDKINCQKADIDPDKGVILSGPVGCGKTSLMRLVRHIVPLQKSYEIIPCRNIVFAFNGLGYSVIEGYGDSGFYCFDDLGVEATGRHYGKDCNVMGEVLLSRHDLYVQSKRKIKTHLTTNLNASELEAVYGHRVRSRMRELFNVIAFDKKTNDKRK